MIPTIKTSSATAPILETSQITGRFQGIQVLRILAAAAVALAHWLPISEYARLGGVGVDLFFVISGFIMAKVGLLKSSGPKAATIFLRRRFARIAPIYWLVTLAVFATLSLTGSSPGWIALIKSLAFVPYRFNDPNIDSPIVLVGWTLNYEIFFYLMVGLIMAIQPKRPLLVISMMLIFLVSLHGIFQPEQLLLRHYTNPVMLEFLSGLLIAWAIEKIKSSGARIGALTLIAGLAILPLAQALRPGLQHGHPAYILGSAMLVYGVVAVEQSVNWPRWGVQFGDASYSLYLLHSYWLAGAIVFFPWITGFSIGVEWIIGFAVVAMAAIASLAMNPVANWMTKHTEPILGL